jgi:ATP-dependent Lon protease
MPDADLDILGLFPLQLVLLPGEHVPLHIFEPRYRALVADTTLGARPFVLSLATDAGVAKIGCTATPVTLVRRFADGRMNVVVEGGERVEIVEQTGGEMYLTARVRPVPDTDVVPDLTLADGVRTRFRAVTEAIAGAAADLPERAGIPLSYAVAGAIALDDVTKQKLLECPDETERLVTVQRLLDSALAELDRPKVAAERGHVNGKVHLP